MTNYLHTAFGTLNGSFPWSITAVSTSVNSEAAVETAWNSMWSSIWGNATLKPFISAQTELTGTSTSTADATFHQTTKTTTTDALVGTSASAALSYRDCTIVTLRTAQATRWGRGRWFLPGLAVNALSTNGFFYSAAATAALAGALTAAVTTFNSTAGLQILHRKATAHGPGAFTLTPVFNGDVSDEIGSQRRRADKRSPIRTTWSL